MDMVCALITLNIWQTCKLRFLLLGHCSGSLLMDTERVQCTCSLGLRLFPWNQDPAYISVCVERKPTHVEQCMQLPLLVYMYELLCS